jgi:ATP-dependent Clp protease ATP-binding subunit ClpB
MQVLRKEFLPEFLNRIDEITVFHPLNKHEIRQIVDLQLTGLGRRLEKEGYSLTVTDEAKTLLANEGYDPVFGARPLKRVIQSRLQNELANRILDGSLPDGATITVGVQNGEFTFDAQVGRSDHGPSEHGPTE